MENCKCCGQRVRDCRYDDFFYEEVDKRNYELKDISKSILNLLKDNKNEREVSEQLGIHLTQVRATHLALKKSNFI